MDNYCISSEFGKLAKVILGTADGFTQGERINDGMCKYYGTESGPTERKLAAEYLVLKNLLEKYGCSVYQPVPSAEVPQQLASRDIGFVIGDTFVFGSMARESRKKEAVHIRHIVKRFAGKVIYAPDNVCLEGGNIIVDGAKIFVGIGIRTTVNSIDFLKEEFGHKYTIIPVFLSVREEIIHLDAVFNILDKDNILVYPEGIIKIPDEFSRYNMLTVTKKEKDLGACNFLSIDHRTKIFRKDLVSLTNKLRKMGYKIETINWAETKKTGTTGPRCAVLPLIRLKI